MATDSFIESKSLASFYKTIYSTIMFSFAKENIYVKDFKNYASMLNHSGNALASRTIPEQMKEFEKLKSVDYYRDHYEEYNPAIKRQIKEFEEANLLFVAMDKNVWSKASEDSIGLRNFYKANADKYNWNKGVSGILITVNSKDVCKELSSKLEGNINNWRTTVSSYGGVASADSA